MKRLFYILFAALISFSASAQTQSFEFYYIAHDRTTPVAELCNRLEQVYEIALSYEDYAVIFYLPNYDDPKIVKVNLPGDNRDDFKNIIIRYPMIFFNNLVLNNRNHCITAAKGECADFKKCEK